MKRIAPSQGSSVAAMVRFGRMVESVMVGRLGGHKVAMDVLGRRLRLRP